MAQILTTCAAAKTINSEVVVGSGWKQLTYAGGPFAALTSCLRVWVLAPRAGNTKGSANTSDIFVCESPTQPSAVDGGWAIASDGSRDKPFHIDNPANLWFHGSTAGDAVEVAVEF